MEDKVRKFRAEFITSAAEFSQLPPAEYYEYCVLGRSNVGKSSFMNHALESGNISRVSKKPGKTALANYFRVDTDMVWVDLPGYGYAKASMSEKSKWSKLIYDYCSNRENLLGIIWLVDIRHIPQKADIEAFNWFCELKMPLFPVFTKVDKLRQTEVSKQANILCKYYGFLERPVLYTTMKHVSRKRFWDKFMVWHKHRIADNG